MDGHLVPASSNLNIRCPLENFTLDAERWLAALYWSVRTSYGDDYPCTKGRDGCSMERFE
jgi:hypothetical protein